jgi:hypothetical protein
MSAAKVDIGQPSVEASCVGESTIARMMSLGNSYMWYLICELITFT